VGRAAVGALAAGDADHNQRFTGPREACARLAWTAQIVRESHRKAAAPLRNSLSAAGTNLANALHTESAALSNAGGDISCEG
jgi:hypothetical protein